MDVVSPILERAGAGYVIKKLIDVAATYMRDQYYWKTDLQEELQSLELLLPQIEAVVDFAEGRLTWYEGSNRALMKWLRQFRNEIDEAEEVLDELEYRELEKKANSDKSKASRTVNASVKAAKRLLKFDDVLGRLKTCVKNLNTSASGVEKFLALVTQTGGVGTGQMQQEIPPLSNQSRITSALPVLSFKGRKEEKGKIIQHLLGESVEESEIQISENVHCLPLVAMGGMGKTTLAQQVFDYFENVKKEHFDVKIWVYVSTDFNASDLIKKILKYPTGGSESEPLERLPVKLKEELHSKRFLLVLDDVWDDKNQTEWEKLCAPLLYGQKGSWILLTTRLNSVAKMVSKVIRGTMEPMMLQGLSDDECRSLLYEHAFAGGDPTEFPLLKKIGEEIMKKLGGVPLLAKSIGGALNSKLERGHWMRISESEVWKTSPDSREEFIPALTLSYVMLPPRLKRCFSYCGIFPQGYRFDKQKLVGMWVAAGLIYSDGSEEGSDEVLANCCFDMLCNKSFFDVHTRKYWSRFVSFYDTAEDIYYTMHDMLNGLARHVSRYECCRIVDVPPSSILDYKAIRHISISISISITSTDAQLHNLANMVCKLKHLRTLWIQSDIEDPQRFVDFIRDACKSPRRIRVLIMKCKTTISCRSISDFVKLRFLDISAYGQPPSLSICKFYFLQVLIGHGNCPILAKDANKLINLRHLYGVKEDALLSVAKVGKLTSLQKLCFSVGTEPGHRIDELMNMNDLHQLKIKELSNVRSFEEANEVNLVGKRNLTRLELHYRNEKSSNPDLVQQEVLAALRPPPKIRELFIRHYKGGSPAPWMDTSYLSYLESLELDACTNLEELPPLWKLPCLKFLKLHQMEAIKSLGCHSSDQMDTSSLSYLESLELDACTNLKELPWRLPRLKFLKLNKMEAIKSLSCLSSDQMDTSSLSRLESLELYACTNLEELPPLWKLSCLKFLKLNQMEAIKSLGCHSSDQMGIQFPVLEEVEFVDLRFWEEWNGADDYIWFPRLKSFEIVDCPKLKKIPDFPLSIENLKMENLGLKAFPRSYKCSNSSRTFGSIGEVDDNLLPSSLKKLSLGGILDKHEDLASYLRGLTSLTELDLDYSSAIESLPLASELEHLTALQHLSISNGEALISPGGLYIIKSLKRLQICNCPKFLSAEVESQEFLKDKTRKHAASSSSVFDHSASNKAASILPSSLESLYISYSNISQESLGRCLQGLTSLKVLRVSGCRNLVSLPNIEYLRNLTALGTLDISDCEELHELESLTALVSLRYLDIRRCPKLLATTFSTLQNPATTREQSATKIKKGTLPSLEDIIIDNIFYLPILPMPERLKTLYIDNQIENFPVPYFPSEIEQWLLQWRESLEDLTLGLIPHLQSLLANLESFSSLRILNLDFAPNLESLPKMPISLERLRISGCSAELQKRCQENIGRDWPNIKHILYIDITGLRCVNSNKESPLYLYCILCLLINANLRVVAYFVFYTYHLKPKSIATLELCQRFGV